MKRRITSIILILMMAVLSLTACGGNNVSSGEGETKTVTDCIGREVEIPKDPQRVACLYAPTAHTMAMLDEEEKIVGAPRGVKSDVLMQMKYPEITEVAVPHQEGSINAEELLRIDTDLILVGRSIAENEGETEKLDEVGIPYMVIDYENIEELENSIIVMGKIFNKEKKAQSYIDFAHETEKIVEEKLGNVNEKEKPQVYHSVNEAIRTDEAGGICAEIMDEAGVTDISASEGIKAEGDKTYVTLEEIYKWDPDAIINNESSVTEYMLTDSKWEGLTAVKNKKVYTLPVGASRWCHPGSIEAHMGILAVAEMFYPEKFKDFDMKSYVADYYEEYFGLKLDNETVEKIIAGEGMRIANSPVQ